MLGAEIISKSLKSSGIRRVYFYPGGTIAPILDSLLKEGIEIICTKNEQGAAYAAIGAAKISGKTQVVMVTSGPGATNVLTPVADAYYDSIPLLVLTGQVGTKDINHEKKLRQTGFQETDTISIFKPVTKDARILNFDDDISEVIHKSFNYACKSRQGPVVIDLPMDVQRTEAKVSLHPVKETEKQTTNKQLVAYSQIVNVINQSKRPLILAGNGVYLSDSVSLLRQFVKKTNIPVISSLPGNGIMPSNHRLYYKFLGHTGEFSANLAAYHSDLLIVLGARLDLRQTGTETTDFTKNKTIVRVDVDEDELNETRIKANINIEEDLGIFLKNLTTKINNLQKNHQEEWLSILDNWKETYNSNKFYQGKDLFSYDMVKAVDEVTKDQKVVVSTGVGIHQHIAARYFTYDYPKRKFLTSAGHGAMGYDIPAAMGAVIEEKKKTLGIVFVGDGSFQMNIQELATISEMNLPIKIIILDNNRLGLVSQFQMANWGKDPGTGNKVNPSFAKIAQGYGIKSYEISAKKDIKKTILKAFSDISPTLVHCHVKRTEDIMPMLMAGQKLNEMWPHKETVNL
jgi:acetolactate synthase I/II/III large subunit